MKAILHIVLSSIFRPENRYLNHARLFYENVSYFMYLYRQFIAIRHHDFLLFFYLWHFHANPKNLAKVYAIGRILKIGKMKLLFNFCFKLDLKDALYRVVGNFRV